MDLYEQLKLPDSFDTALIGTAHRVGQGLLLVYSVDGILDVLERQGMSPEEAQEWFDYNIEGAYLGPGTPIYVR